MRENKKVWGRGEINPRVGAAIMPATKSYRRVRIVLWSFLAGLAYCALTPSAIAQAYPTKQIRVISPYVSGGGSDLVARAFAAALHERFGQPAVVENRGGANGNIALDLVASAPPDGHTLLLCTSALAINPSLYKTSYDPINSFTPISMILRGTLLLVVHPSVPARDVKELIVLAKKQPGQLTFSSFGSGSPAHLAGELMKDMSGIDMLHVPYKGSAPALLDVIAGRVSMTFSVMTVVLPHVKAGKVRAIGLATKERSEGYEEFRTLDESGLRGFEVAGWNGVCGPAGLPKEISARLHSLIVETFGSDAMRSRFVKMGYGILRHPTSPEEFAAKIRSDFEKWAKVIKAAGIKPD